VDNKDFQEQVISMLGQILEKQSELAMNQNEQVERLNELNMRFNDRGAKLDTVIEQLQFSPLKAVE